MKNSLRKKIKEIRKAFSGEERTVNNQKICANFLQNFSHFKSYFIYNSFGSEADTSGIVATLLSKSKQIYMPKINNGEMLATPLTGEFTKGAFGISEPVGDGYFGEIEVAVIPLLAVNNKGFRLGYGGGFYDRFLKGRQIVKVGIAFSFQHTEVSFEEEWDEPLDYLVTENGVISFK